MHINRPQRILRSEFVGFAIQEKFRSMEMKFQMTQGSMSYSSIIEQELSSWSVSGRIVLIENLEPFLHAEIVHADFDFAVYYAGTISSLVLEFAFYTKC